MAQFHRQSLAGHVHVHVHLAGRVVGTVPRVLIQLTLVAKFSTPYFRGLFAFVRRYHATHCGVHSTITIVWCVVSSIFDCELGKDVTSRGGVYSSSPTATAARTRDTTRRRAANTLQTSPFFTETRA